AFLALDVAVEILALFIQNIRESGRRQNALMLASHGLEVSGERAGIFMMAPGRILTHVLAHDEEVVETAEKEVSFDGCGVPVVALEFFVVAHNGNDIDRLKQAAQSQ